MSDRNLQSAIQKIQQATQMIPKAGIILGSGLGGLSRQIQSVAEFPFEQIPGLKTSHASGHEGRLILGYLQQQPVIAMAGRLHRYEGYSSDEVTYPIRLIRSLGAGVLLASNAAGGLNPKYCVGDPIILGDHINWLGQASTEASPPNVRDQSTGFLQSGSNFYCSQLTSLAISVAKKNDFSAYVGTYLGTLGPTYETRSEYRMMRRIGADVVGMSTLPEVLLARRLGMKTLAVSIVSNVANPDSPSTANHDEVIRAGQQAGSKLEKIIRAVLDNLDNQVA
ncbi:purine-nucleoside phosphorylase [bacterium]|nr:purine-nucleoside phosphorylase [bacterium]